MLANGIDVADACCFGVGRIAAPKMSGSPAPVSSFGLGAPPPKRDAALPIDMAFVLRAVPVAPTASFPAAVVDVAAAVSELPVALS